jgi:N-acetylglucosaminyldiphosphoundecaprenol N-acetyl-beta-D-mannosaminyltransferase
MQSNPPPAPKTCSVLGSRLAITDYARAVEQARAWASARDRAYAVAAANTHVVTLGRHDPEFGRALGKFDLLLPDGMPLVWCMNRICGTRLGDRVYGPTFMLRCLAATEGNEQHFLLGGSEDLLAALRAKLGEKFPKLQIAGAYAPPFGTWPDGEDERIIERIAESGARYVWVGLGCPKQELWIARNKERLPASVHCAVGAAFAFHAGRVKQAPAWMQRNGLEWMFRLLAEPHRLWRRYLVYNSLFAYYLARDRFIEPPHHGQR